MPKKTKSAKREFAPVLYVTLHENNADDPSEGYHYLTDDSGEDWKSDPEGTRVAIYKLQQVNVVQQSPALVNPDRTKSTDKRTALVARKGKRK